jgi:hypothetical protein
LYAFWIAHAQTIAGVMRRVTILCEV